MTLINRLSYSIKYFLCTCPQVEFKISPRYILTIGTYDFVIGHTKPKAPDPIRTPKLSGLRRG